MSARQRFFFISVTLALTALVGVFDYLTGYHVSLAIFYYIPIAYAAWFLGQAAALSVCFICVGTMAWAELQSGAHYPGIWYFAERSIVRLIAFGFVGFSFGVFRRINDSQKRRIGQLEGMITFCTCCHRLQDGHGDWIELEEFRRENPELSRNKLCPNCARTNYLENNLRQN